MRYCLLSYALCIREISVRMRKRFPSLKSIVQYGLLRSSEQEKVRESWWGPILWSMELLGREEGLYRYGKHHLLERLTDWKKKLSDVTAYSMAPVPLVYTQVVHLAVYIFFSVSLLADQWIIWRKPGDEEIDVIIFPFFIAFKFLFIFGWLRVAETLYDPFGEDDEDFDVNALLHRHKR